MFDPVFPLSAFPAQVIAHVRPDHAGGNSVVAGAHSEAYFADQRELHQALIDIRDERKNRPGWNTLKEVLWAPCSTFFQLGQSVGSFAGHLLFALPAALVGGVFGVAVYAPFMKTLDCLAVERPGRSLCQYAIKPAQVLANMVYNRVTDFFSRYLLGPALLTAVVEPLLIIAAGTAVVAAASPFIYRDFASNSARNVEYYIDCPLSTSVKHFINHHFWQRFDDVASVRNGQDRSLQQMKAYVDQLRHYGDDEHIFLAGARGKLNAHGLPPALSCLDC